jgi:hypothetical protein
MTGILIIVAIAVVAVIGAFALHAAFHRFGRTRPRAMERHPAREGRVGRISEFRER